MSSNIQDSRPIGEHIITSYYTTSRCYKLNAFQRWQVSPSKTGHTHTQKQSQKTRHDLSLFCLQGTRPGVVFWAPGLLCTPLYLPLGLLWTWRLHQTITTNHKTDMKMRHISSEELHSPNFMTWVVKQFFEPSSHFKSKSARLTSLTGDKTCGVTLRTGVYRASLIWAIDSFCPAMKYLEVANKEPAETVARGTPVCTLKKLDKAYSSHPSFSGLVSIAPHVWLGKAACM